MRLHWLPLGAGGRSVRWNGRVFEWVAARREGRPACDLYHAALEVAGHGGRYVVEMAPAWDRLADERGVVCTGPVGLRRLGRWVWFRYEVRLWRDGVIPDLADEAGPALEPDTGPERVARLLDAARRVPSLTWGRDELGLGDMWNSNSLVAWLLAVSGHDLARVTPPPRGRAPGWDAGLELARHQQG